MVSEAILAQQLTRTPTGLLHATKRVSAEALFRASHKTFRPERFRWRAYVSFEIRYYPKIETMLRNARQS